MSIHVPEDCQLMTITLEDHSSSLYIEGLQIGPCKMIMFGPAKIYGLADKNTRRPKSMVFADVIEPSSAKHQPEYDVGDILEWSQKHFLITEVTSSEYFTTCLQTGNPFGFSLEYGNLETERVA